MKKAEHEKKTEHIKKTDRKKKKGSLKKGRLIFYGILVFFILSWIWSWVPVTERISIDLIPEDAEPVRIVLITDLHSCYYGREQRSLIRRVEKEDPDIILLGGDIFDDNLDNGNSMYFVEAMAAEYSCFYVTGNHEYWSGKVPEIKEYLESLGVNVLAGDCRTLEFGDTLIDICGVDDPTRIRHHGWEDQLKAAFEAADESHVRILLSHRPELYDVYEQYDFDLICAGHAHAGQILIPFVNRGLYVPDQGTMAEYVNGLYELPNGSYMAVSRGLARESTPAPRYFNHPEVLVIDLY
ncbi:MAG: metallophosphoesterase [Lachnospiraceae bacterium]|nr:metallophosphoesterase [Lachnospiraceae bacterium]